MIWRRLLSLIPLLLLVSFVVFCLELFLPGDAAVSLAGQNATEQRIEEIRDELQLDEPLVKRYVAWMGDAVTGDLGRSLFTRRAVTSELGDRLGVTLSLMAGAVLVAVAVGFPLGLASGVREGSWIDRASTLVATLGVAIPHFVVGMVLIVVFALRLDWLPTSGYEPLGDGFVPWLEHLVLPTIALSGVLVAEVSRQLRSSLHGTLRQGFVRTARAKGLTERTILFKHTLRVAVAPVIVVLSVSTARLFGAAVVVEEVFRLPGMGRLTVQAILQRDLPLLQGIVPVAVLIAVGTALLGDLALMGLDPRLRRRTS